VANESMRSVRLHGRAGWLRWRWRGFWTIRGLCRVNLRPRRYCSRRYDKLRASAPGRRGNLRLTRTTPTNAVSLR
jgi:hypothetical protein